MVFLLLSITFGDGSGQGRLPMIDVSNCADIDVGLLAVKDFSCKSPHRDTIEAHYINH